MILHLGVQLEAVVCQDLTDLGNDRLIPSHIAGHHRDHNGVGGVDNGGAVVELHAPAVLKAAVFLGDLILLSQGLPVIALRLGIQQALHHVGEALSLGVQGGHDLGHVAVAEIAILQVVRVVIFFLQLGVFFGVLPPFVVAAQILADGMGPVVVGIGEDVLLNVGHDAVIDLAVLAQLPIMYLLRQQHHQGHLVHAGRIEPFIAVKVPAVPGGGVIVAHADLLGVYALLIQDLLDLGGEDGAVNDAVGVCGAGQRCFCFAAGVGTVPGGPGQAAGQQQGAEQQARQEPVGFAHITPSFSA